MHADLPFDVTRIIVNHGPETTVTGETTGPAGRQRGPRPSATGAAITGTAQLMLVIGNVPEPLLLAGD